METVSLLVKIPRVALVARKDTVTTVYSDVWSYLNISFMTNVPEHEHH